MGIAVTRRLNRTCAAVIARHNITQSSLRRYIISLVAAGLSLASSRPETPGRRPYLVVLDCQQAESEKGERANSATNFNV